MLSGYMQFKLMLFKYTSDWVFVFLKSIPGNCYGQT